MKTEFDRWNSKVIKSDCGCWEWSGAKTRGGYGHFRRKLNNKHMMYKAHRFSFEYFKNNGVLLDSNTLVCHTCDNPKCVNPSHLFTGSSLDNIQDKLTKGRHRWGHKKGYRVLSEEDVIKIRSDYLSNSFSMKEVALMNNTSVPQVSRIVNNKTHKVTF
jgi:hypothetical protein